MTDLAARIPMPIPDWHLEARETGRAWAEEHAIGREIARGAFIGDIQGAHHRLAAVPEELRARAAYHCLEAARDRWAELTYPVCLAALEHALADFARASERIPIPESLGLRFEVALGKGIDALAQHHVRELLAERAARQRLKPGNDA